MTMTDLRLQQLQQFVQQSSNGDDFTIQPLAGDASFRRYFRVFLPNQTLVAMDAPPDKEDSHPFVATAKTFAAQGLQVPEIIQADLSAGFLLISDLGDDLYFKILNNTNADELYKNAINKLITIQACAQKSPYDFPTFAPLLIEELKRFKEWYLETHLKLSLTTTEQHLLADTFQLLADNAAAQPQLCVHRDYHSRNLMRLPNKGVGILDFQDAVWGPATYDLVSLIRDCYIAWPNEQVEQWALYYYQQALEQGTFDKKNPTQFLQCFDWMGIQRHLKASFIFARKWHRDQNPNYLAEIPRTLNYVLTVSEKYPEFKKFREFMQNVET